MLQKATLTKLFSMSTLLVAMCGCGGGGGGSGGGGNSSAASSTPTEITLSGTVSGLTTTGLILQNNGGDDLTINANGNFSFSQKVTQGNAYTVTIKSQPLDPIPSKINNQLYSCGITNATGTAGKTNISNIAINCNSIMVYSGSVSAGNEPWVTDGTPNNAKLLKDIEKNLNSSNPSFLIRNKGWIYFTTFNDIQSVSLWKTNGTTEGTTLIKTLTTSGTIANYIPREAIVFNDAIYFAAFDDTHGVELWKSDGTADGTTMVKDIKTGTGNSGPASFRILNGNLFFFAVSDSTIGLWKTDGTELGTTLVHDTQLTTGWEELSVFSGGLYFAASDSQHGIELWKSDGTEAGTSIVKDIAPGTTGSVFNLHFIANSTSLFFIANDGTSSALWSTDGTLAGTLKLKNIMVSSSPISMTVFKDAVYFPAKDNNLENCLWKSDGTVQGTTLVENQIGYVNNIVGLNDSIYFSAAAPGTLNAQLWKTDGTNATLLQDFGRNLIIGNNTGNNNIYPFNNKLYFTFADNPWVSDGTTTGTFKLKALLVKQSSWHDTFFAIGSKLFFSAHDEGVSSAWALWTTDGTTTGTSSVQSDFEF